MNDVIRVISFLSERVFFVTKSILNQFFLISLSYFFFRDLLILLILVILCLLKSNIFHRSDIGGCCTTASINKFEMFNNYLIFTSA